jgi:RND family efflux transporter MFP subunit
MSRFSSASLVLLLGLSRLGAGQSEGRSSTEVVKVMSRTLDKSISVPSDLMAFQSVAIYAKVSGFVESIEVDRGSWVRAGQIIAVITAPELQARTVEAEARLQEVASKRAEATANMLAAESNYHRLKAAADTPGAVAGHDLEVAERRFEAAKANTEAIENSVKAAEAAVRAVREMEGYLELRAPFEGVVTERNAHPGTLVGPSATPVVRIEQVSRLRLLVPVPETYVGGITLGAGVSFEVAAYPDRTFTGIVKRPAHSLDIKTRSMLVELDVENPDRTLAPGMFANVQWPVSRKKPTLCVPTSAVVRTSERQFVIRVRDGVAEWVDVRRGEVSGELIEVFGELHEGDLIVRRGNDEIRPGSRITSSIAPSSQPDDTER